MGQTQTIHQTNDIFEELNSIMEYVRETKDMNPLLFFFKRCEIAISKSIPIPMNDLIDYESPGDKLIINVKQGIFNIPTLFANTPLNLAIYCKNVEGYDYIYSLLN